MRGSTRAALVLAIAMTAACDRLMPERPDTTLPPIEDVQALYARQGLGDVDVRYSGNVIELVAQQPYDQLRRGGSLWARLGPYIYLFSPGTPELLEAYPGVAGVRAITQTDGTEVARALLVRDRLNDIMWRRARTLLGRALEEGTERPSLMERLVQFGEEHTQFEYNPRFVAPR